MDLTTVKWLAFGIWLLICGPFILNVIGLFASAARNWPLAALCQEIVILMVRPMMAIFPSKYVGLRLAGSELNLTYAWAQMNQNDERAAVLLTEAANIYRRYCGPQSVDRARVLLNLSGVLSRSQRFDEAVAYEKEIIEIFNGEREDVLEASALVTHSGTLLRIGKPKDARDSAQRAITILNSIAGNTSGNPKLALSPAMNNLAIAHGYMYDWSKAAEIFQQTLAMKKAKLPDRDPAVISALNNCAWASVKANHLGAAAEYLSAAHQAAKDNPFVNDSMHFNMAINQAELFRRQGKTDEAEQELTRGLAKHGTKRDDTLATAYGELANIYRDKGDYSEADRWYKDSMEIWKQFYPNGHPKMIAVLLDYAQYLRAAGKVEYAQRTTERAEAMIDALKLDRERFPALARSQESNDSR